MSSRDRIVDAAMEVFVRYGYRLTSMELVGQEAGLTRQALYHHFETKEALFRAVVEAVHQGANEAGAAAGLEQERADTGLADVLSAQIIARLRYISDCASGSPQAEELLSEHQRQSRDLHEAFIQQGFEMIVAAIDRFGARGLRLQAGTTSLALARCIQLAANGVDIHAADDGALADLDRTIHLLVTGALAAPAKGARAVNRKAKT